MVGQILVSISRLVVVVAGSAFAIGVGLSGLHLIIIGFKDLGMFLIDIVDVVADLIVVVGVTLGRVGDEDILYFTGISHWVCS